MDGEQWLQDVEAQEIRDDVRKLCSYLILFNWGVVADIIPTMIETAEVIREFADKYTHPSDRR